MVFRPGVAARSPMGGASGPATWALPFVMLGLLFEKVRGDQCRRSFGTSSWETGMCFGCSALQESDFLWRSYISWMARFAFEDEIEDPEQFVAVFRAGKVRKIGTSA